MDVLGIPREWPELFDALVELHNEQTEDEQEAVSDADAERRRALLAVKAASYFQH